MYKLISYFALVFIYMAVAIAFWRNAKAPIAAQNLRLHSFMIVCGLVVHAYLLEQTIFAGGYNLGFFNILSVIAWLTVLIYWITDLNQKLTSLQAFVLPPAALFALLPAGNTASYLLPAAESPLFLTHIAIALLAYGLFTFAALHALLMLVAERTLHNKPSLIKLPSLPPLMVMESLLFKIIGLGFVLLTITLVSGILFSEEIFDKPIQFNHKTVFSIASWLIYGWLLYARIRYGWRGLKAIRWTLGGFILLVLAYVGTKFILAFILHRPPVM